VVGIFLIAGGINSPAAQSLKLRVGTEGTYPPFNFRDKDGVLQGFDVDIANEICKRIGADHTFVLQEWDGMLPGLLAGKFDLIVASMSITEERQKRVDFSIPYRGSTGRFVTRKGANMSPFKADGELDPDALKGKSAWRRACNNLRPVYRS
jgi:ABC-type amino acid transport substrate-binding protein